MPSRIDYDRERRNPCGCGIAALMSAKRNVFSGELVVKSLDNMRERGNGLGAGYAGYGIYPDRKNYYSLHLMYDHDQARQLSEDYLRSHFRIFDSEPIPTRANAGISSPPIFYRYFVLPKEEAIEPKPGNLFSPEAAPSAEQSSDEFVMNRVTEVNSRIQGAFIISSGKNMGVFKGVGFPLEIGEFFRLDEYQAYCWIGHSRFPTNTPGWWGGAHPFTMLDTSVVHNGEISSYGINRRYVEMFGYRCAMMTDSEVVAYIFDFLHRRQKIPLALIPAILSSEFWQNIDRLDQDAKELYQTIRQVYGSALLNGPYAIVVGHRDGMFGLSDRVKLRPMIAARKEDVLYIASEESGIREICPEPDLVWMPRAGELVAASYDEVRQ